MIVLSSSDRKLEAHYKIAVSALSLACQGLARETTAHSGLAKLIHPTAAFNLE